jgi:hypothetical protein
MEDALFAADISAGGSERIDGIEDTIGSYVTFITRSVRPRASIEVWSS